MYKDLNKHPYKIILFILLLSLSVNLEASFKARASFLEKNTNSSSDYDILYKHTSDFFEFNATSEYSRDYRSEKYGYRMGIDLIMDHPVTPFIFLDDKYLRRYSNDYKYHRLGIGMAYTPYELSRQDKWPFKHTISIARVLDFDYAYFSFRYRLKARMNTNWLFLKKVYFKGTFFVFDYGSSHKLSLESSISDNASIVYTLSEEKIDRLDTLIKNYTQSKLQLQLTL